MQTTSAAQSLLETATATAQAVIKSTISATIEVLHVTPTLTTWNTTDPITTTAAGSSSSHTITTTVHNTTGGGTSHHATSGLDMLWVLNENVHYVALVSVILSCIISIRDIREHLERFDYPRIQVLVIRILVMIPIYSIFSIASIFFVSIRFFLITVRDTYESFVLYMFLLLLLAYCGGEGQLLRSLRAKRYKGAHPFPMCYIPMYPLDRSFYLRCKRWVLQCALIKPVCSFIAMVFAPLGLYNESNYNLNNIYPYTTVLINFSLTWALYYLVLFEIELEKELHYCQPFLKFLSIKAIVFFSFWQSVMVTMLVAMGWLYIGSEEIVEEEVNGLIQDILMCFELLPVSVMHHYAFSRTKLDLEMAAVPIYMKEDTVGSLRSNIDTALNIHDVVEDTIATVFYRRGKLVDQENMDDGGGEETDDEIDVYSSRANGAMGGPGSSSATAGDTLFGMRAGGGTNIGDLDMTMITMGRDPTVDELVRHAVITDYGVRADGLLHYDDDSDRDERNFDMNYTDTDVMLHRSRLDKATADVVVDTDLLRSQQQQSSAPSIYCVVCGRFDREMVRRRNGYKCKECVGSKSTGVLRTRQLESQRLPEDNGTSACSVCGRSDLPMVTRENTVRCINCLNDSAP